MEYFIIRKNFKHQLNHLARKLDAINKGHLQLCAYCITNYACPKYTPSYTQIFDSNIATFENISGYETEIRSLYQKIKSHYQWVEEKDMHGFIVFSYLVSKRKYMEKQDDFSWVNLKGN